MGFKQLESTSDFKLTLCKKNTFFFSQATKEECQGQMGIVAKYRRALGHMVNFDKPMLFFSSNVENGTQQRIRETFEVVRCQGDMCLLKLRVMF